MNRTKIRLCHHCMVLLSEDDVLHYVYECHACAFDEHDRSTTARRSGDVEALTKLSDGPVEIDRRRREDRVT